MPFSPASSSLPSLQERKTRVPIYSFTWCAEKVEQALQSRARAWEILLGLAGLTPRQCAYLLSCNDPAWPFMRLLSHTLDKWLCKQSLVRSEALPCTSYTLQGLLDLHKNSAPKSLLAYLTGRIQQLKLEEQVKRGEGEGFGPTSPSLWTMKDGHDDYS
jgi:hypothetical protein